MQAFIDNFDETAMKVEADFDYKEATFFVKGGCSILRINIPISRNT